MKMNKIIKGSLAAAVIYLIVSFPLTATPLFSEANNSCSPDVTNTASGLNNSSNSDYTTANEWRKYDINGDGKFDKTDINELIDRGGLDFEFDLNEDGKKDVDDVLALFLKLSVMDRSCNRVVDDEDYEPVDPVSLPDVPDIQTVRRLVNDCISHARINLPFDIEDQAFRSVSPGELLTLEERASVYQMAGMSGLAQQNLDAATWGYGRAFQTDERSAGAIGSLAFCLAADDNDNDALLLLAYARHLFRESAPTATSLGWVFARHGQNEVALEYLREAVFYAPEIAQYHMNLGILLMRMGIKREAYEEFREATERDPGDAKKMLFWYTTKPPDVPPAKKPFDADEFKKEREIEINEMEELGYSGDELPVSWDKMSPCDQASTIPEILERKYSSQMDEIAQAYANDLAKQIEGVIKEFWPQWKNMPEDWNRFIAGVPVVSKAEKRLTLNAEIAAGHRRAALTRQMGSELLGYSSFFMESALQQAKTDANAQINSLKGMPVTAESVAELKAEAYRDALEEAIKNCYKAPINQAYRWLTAESRPYGLPFPKIEVLNSQDFMMLSMAIPLECFNIKDYCPDGKGGDTRKPDMPLEHTVSLDLLIVSFEWNTDTDEIEFNVGQGIIVGVTWKPETGFGFQIGAGIELMGMEEAIYARFDEGKITIQSEEGYSIGFGPLSAGWEVTKTQATFEFP
jgi:tetratricopeptide (TPR) repeat protein